MILPTMSLLIPQLVKTPLFWETKSRLNTSKRSGQSEFSGEIIGSVGLERTSDVVGEVRRMTVDNRTRGKGVGKLLLDTLEAHARQMGLKELFLSTMEVNQTSRSFYTKMGYHLWTDAEPYVFIHPDIGVVFFRKLL
eukprot:TRINITY_DN10639_c0_g1_i3.p1 TRINITY_DN10639_c0_g1~~TRINITY_DN10639_c0_g1_i3.p1  ORF type:complete len:137 (-),score=5.73 TRINITY_DN10639_c0_g1_i3:22-432(-)